MNSGLLCFWRENSVGSMTEKSLPGHPRNERDAHSSHTSLSSLPPSFCRKLLYTQRSCRVQTCVAI